MNNENTFSYTYSAKENQEVQNIRKQYEAKHYTELDALKALDAKVKKPANVFAYTYGSVGAIIMGAGMSLVMTDIGAIIGLTSAMVPGIVIGVVGLALVKRVIDIMQGTIIVESAVGEGTTFTVRIRRA